MKLHRFITLVIYCLVIGLLTVHASASEWENTLAAARKEGRVVLYASSIGDAKQLLINGFKKRYGIDLEFILGRSSELVQKMMTERSNGIYAVDAGLQGLTTYFGQIRPLNVLVKLDLLLTLPEVFDTSRWRSGKLNWTDRDKTAFTFCGIMAPYVSINTDMVKDNEVTSNEDTLAPKFKGKTVINDPTISGQGAEWFSFIVLQALGKEKGEQYMRALARQEPLILRDQRQQVEWVARGKYAMGLGLTPSEVVRMASSGAPIKYIETKEGSPFTSGPMNIMVFDRAPHPNATKVFFNWLLTDEGGHLAAQGSGYPSERLGVSNKGFDPITVPRRKDILPGEEYKLAQNDMIKLAQKIFPAK